jgi:hypothetical protein
MNTDLDQVACLRSVDAEYRFDRPKVYLTPLELARLMIVRSKLGDTQAERAAEQIRAIATADQSGGVHSS